jgi:hypothetical protein
MDAKKKGYCNTHYQRLRRHGNVSIIKRQGNSVLMKWITKNVDHDGDECLEWPFNKSTDGRGQITIKGKNMKANRIMCELAHGPPPSREHQAAHSCGKGHEGCINPKHLSWKTRKENEADKLIHGTRLRGESAFNAKISEVDALEIRKRARSETCASLAREFNLHPGTISQIKRGVLWKHVKEMGDDAVPYATAVINQGILR